MKVSVVLDNALDRELCGHYCADNPAMHWPHMFASKDNTLVETSGGFR
jgi:hypothetical protein